MNEEQYVTYKVGNLLNEKGFDWNTDKVYERNLMACRYEDVPMPSQAMTCDWLRKKHNILVCVIPYEVGAGVMDYTYCIYKIFCDDLYFEPLAQGRIEEAMNYEKTLEAGLEFVLTNVI